eukprot:scaffold313328_cov18-Prasinocladus_malaysianus.AAC.1
MPASLSSYESSLASSSQYWRRQVAVLRVAARAVADGRLAGLLGPPLAAVALDDDSEGSGDGEGGGDARALLGLLSLADAVAGGCREGNDGHAGMITAPNKWAE